MDKKITWSIIEEALYHYRKAEDLDKAIQAACAIAPEDQTRLNNYAHFLTCTTRMTYSDGAKASIVNLAQFLTRWQDLPPAALWEYYLKEIPTSLVVEWQQAYNKAQNLFDPDLAELPLSELTPEQRAEAETPGSPLLSPSGVSDKN